MSLKIVYGKSGSGKSSYIFDEIGEKINNGADKKIYIITPEQFSFTLEKKILSVVQNNSVIDAEVLSFSRMASRVITTYFNGSKTNITDSGKAMIIYKILRENQKNLKFIGKSLDNVEMICAQITEFKKHAITIDVLKSIIENTKDKYLKLKLQDILFIYEKYEVIVKGSYIDENDDLTILSELLNKAKEFKNCDIYIDEFAGFTKQEYIIIEELLKNNNNIICTICSDNLKTDTIPDTDIFYFNKKVANKLINISKELGIEVVEPVYINNNNKFKNEELLHLEDNIFNLDFKTYNKELNNIAVNKNKNMYEEIDNVCKEIVGLVKFKGYRYNQIAVVTKDIEKYSSICKNTFNKFDIPLFIDESGDLNQNILIRYILAIINIFSKNWDYNSMIEYIKIGFHDISYYEINIFENYARKFGIKNNKWTQDNWVFFKQSEEEINTILKIKKEIVDDLIKLKKELIKEKTIKNITIKIYEFLIKKEINKKIEKEMNKLKEFNQEDKIKEYEKSWKVVMELFEELILVLGENKVGFEQYLDILKIGLTQKKLGKIPGFTDQVVIGDVDRSRNNNIKTVFIIGFNEGAFPSVNSDEGFLNDNDRDLLKIFGAEIAKGTLDNLYNDNFNIYKALTIPENNLTISYLTSDIEGKVLRPSIYLNKLKKVFIKLKENVEEKNNDKNNNLINEINSLNSTFEFLLYGIRDIKEGNSEINKTKYIYLSQIYKYFKNEKCIHNNINVINNSLEFNIQPKVISTNILDKIYRSRHNY